MAVNFVAVGNGHPLGFGSQVITSPDGITWTRVPMLGSTATTLPFWDVVNQNGQWVLSGGTFDDASDGLANSPDGITWTSQTLPFPADGFRSAAFGVGLWVLLDDVEDIFTSPDLVTWTLRYQNVLEREWKCVAFGAGIFVAVGRFATMKTSPDGITWTDQDGGFAGSDILGVTFAKGIFVAVGAAGKIATSPDGITWTQRTSGTANTINRVAASPTLWVAVSNFAPDSFTILTSADAITWTPANSFGANVDVKGVGFGFGLFVAVGGVVDTSANLATSPDGLTWTQRTPNYGAQSLNMAAALFVPPPPGVSNRISSALVIPLPDPRKNC